MIGSINISRDNQSIYFDINEDYYKELLHLFDSDTKIIK